MHSEFQSFNAFVFEDVDFYPIATISALLSVSCCHCPSDHEELYDAIKSQKLFHFWMLTFLSNKVCF